MEALASLRHRRHGCRYIYQDSLKHFGDLKQDLGWRRDGGVPPHLRPALATQPTTPMSASPSPSCTLPFSVPSASLCVNQTTVFGCICRTRPSGAAAAPSSRSIKCQICLAQTRLLRENMKYFCTKGSVRDESLGSAKEMLKSLMAGGRGGGGFHSCFQLRSSLVLYSLVQINPNTLPHFTSVSCVSYNKD